MNANTKVWKIMTADKDLFKKSNFHHLPVEDNYGEILGIISSADLVRADRFPLSKQTLEARHIMTASLDTVNMDATIKEVLDLFLEKNYRALPIMDKSGVFVGLVTTHDLLRCYQQDINEMQGQETKVS